MRSSGSAATSRHVQAWQEALELRKALQIPEPGDVRARLTELPTSQPGTAG
jgi:hypothetical protein